MIGGTGGRLTISLFCSNRGWGNGDLCHWGLAGGCKDKCTLTCALGLSPTPSQLISGSINLTLFWFHLLTLPIGLCQTVTTLALITWSCWSGGPIYQSRESCIVPLIITRSPTSRHLPFALPPLHWQLWHWLSSVAVAALLIKSTCSWRQARRQAPQVRWVLPSTILPMVWHAGCVWCSMNGLKSVTTEMLFWIAVSTGLSWSSQATLWPFTSHSKSYQIVPLARSVLPLNCR